MAYIIIGSIAFVLMGIYDLYQVRNPHKLFQTFFAAGVFLLAVATVGLLMGEGRNYEVSMFRQLVWGALAMVSLVLLFYSLFFGLPFQASYLGDGRKRRVVDTGMYALCRHPGVIWFGLFYFCLWMGQGNNQIFWAGIVWTSLDVFLVYVEDRWIFPRILEGYDHYRIQVPFLVPDRQSIRRCILSLK